MYAHAFFCRCCCSSSSSFCFLSFFFLIFYTIFFLYVHHVTSTFFHRFYISSHWVHSFQFMMCDALTKRQTFDGFEDTPRDKNEANTHTHSHETFTQQVTKDEQWRANARKNERNVKMIEGKEEANKLNMAAKIITSVAFHFVVISVIFEAISLSPTSYSTLFGQCTQTYTFLHNNIFAILFVPYFFFVLTQQSYMLILVSFSLSVHVCVCVCVCCKT